MSSSDHRGVPQGNAAIIAAVIGGIALVAAAAIGVIIGRGSDGTSPSQTPIIKVITATTIAGNVGGIQATYTPYPPNPTLTPYPTEAQPVTVVPRSPIVFTATPSADEQYPPAGSTIVTGQYFSKHGVTITVPNKLEIYREGGFGIDIIVINRGDQEIVVRWRNSFIHVKDDLNRAYRQYSQDETGWNFDKQFNIPDGGGYEISPCYLCLGDFNDKTRNFLGSIDATAKYLIITIDQMAGMTNMNWRYNLQ